MTEDRLEIRLSGFGGQGVMLAGYILGQAASIFEHKHAAHIRDYGPEARGGTCRADVVISNEPINYPYINAPSILVSLSQQAYDRYRPRSREDSLVIIDEELVKHREKKRNNLMAIPARRLAEELGRAAVANVVILGFFTAVTGCVSIQAMRKSVLASVPQGTEELNIKALDCGYAYGVEKMKAKRRKTANNKK